MIANANGVVFSGTSQVNVRNLLVAATDISKERFDSGLYGDITGAQGKIIVESGALLNTAKPTNSTAGGGYVLLAGKEVHNAGLITAPEQQRIFARQVYFAELRAGGREYNDPNDPLFAQGHFFFFLGLFIKGWVVVSRVLGHAWCAH